MKKNDTFPRCLKWVKIMPEGEFSPRIDKDVTRYGKFNKPLKFEKRFPSCNALDLSTKVLTVKDIKRAVKKARKG